MEILNRSPGLAQMTMGTDPTGRDYLSLVIRATYDFPAEAGAVAGAVATPAAVQTPLVMADLHVGPPGFSHPRWETDFAFRKPRAEVLLQGAAYAPGGRAAERVGVGLRVGDWSKRFDVVGPREWRTAGPVITATRPYPFERLAFGYDTAFGGAERGDTGDPAPATYPLNPFGLGFATVAGQARLSGQALPLTEDPGDPVTSPYGRYRPMALGPRLRGHPERLRWAGTYDQHWVDTVFPFLPADFDDRYYQSAPPDQWIAPPEPFAPVVIRNLTPAGHETFRLPDTRLPVRIFRGAETCLDTLRTADTLLFDTEARQLILLWRVEVPMRRILTEFTEGWIGPPSRAMLRALHAGKTYLRRGSVRSGVRA